MYFDKSKVHIILKALYELYFLNSCVLYNTYNNKNLVKLPKASNELDTLILT